MSRTNKCFIGVWEFSDQVSLHQLRQVAQRWAERDPNYLHLYIRQVSPTKRGIGFVYRSNQSNSRTAYETYFNETINDLKEHFGDLLVGWDIASQVYLIQ